MQTAKNINITVAANDKLVEIETRVQHQKEWIATIIILVASSLFKIEMPIALIIIIYVGWKYFKDLKEIKRMKDTYDL